jgi:hypothetical protein
VTQSTPAAFVSIKHDWKRSPLRLTRHASSSSPGFSGRGPDAVVGWMRAFLAAFPEIHLDAVTGTLQRQQAGTGDVGSCLRAIWVVV